MPSDSDSLAGDGLSQSHPDRCRVCALPLPAGPCDNGICSRRCADRRRESGNVARTAATLKERIVEEISKLKRGTTMCPGELSQRILPGLEQALTLLRPLIFELADARRLRLSQKGTVTIWPKIRGPFRVGPLR